MYCVCAFKRTTLRFSRKSVGCLYELNTQQHNTHSIHKYISLTFFNNQKQKKTICGSVYLKNLPESDFLYATEFNILFLREKTRKRQFLCRWHTEKISNSLACLSCFPLHSLPAI